MKDQDLPDVVASEGQLPLSALLLTLGRDSPGPISLAAVVEHFGPRAFGAVLFVFATPNLLPLPRQLDDPGSATAADRPAACLRRAATLAPGPVGRRTIDRRALVDLCRRASPWVARAERLTIRRHGRGETRFDDRPVVKPARRLMRR